MIFFKFCFDFDFDRELAAKKKEEEDQRKKAEAAKKAAEEEEKKKAMEEAEIKRWNFAEAFCILLTFVLSRQEMMAAQKEGGKKSSGPAMDARKEMSKTKEQVDIRLSINSHHLAPRWRRR